MQEAKLLAVQRPGSPRTSLRTDEGFRPEGGPVRQHGPRRLWDEIEGAHAWWVEHGRALSTRLGVTATDPMQWA